MLKDILSIDCKNNKIIVENNLSEKEVLTMTNVSKGHSSEIFSIIGGSDEAQVFLTCNIDDIVHYGIIIKGIDNVKWHLIKGSEFEEYFKRKEV
jgi:hypothetical protein